MNHQVIHLIEQLAGVVSRTAIEELEYSEGGTRVRLVASGAAARSRTGAIESEAALAVAAPAETAAPSIPLHRIVAGMSGTFYGAPSPGEAPFVKAGDRVKEGQVLAVVEAMKMLNQIEADVDGTLVRIGVADGAAVTSTTVLFEIAPEAASHA